jgi:3-oxoacyl-[acyl-carrier-protein] synthase II
MKQIKRVVVTGLGAVTPIGNTATEFWNALLKGTNGVGLITKFDASRFDTKFAAEVKNFDPTLYIDKKSVRRLDLFSQYAIASAEQAVQDSNILSESLNRERAGVIFGSGVGGVLSFQEQCEAFFAKGRDPQIISPFLITMMIPDMAAGHISIRFGFKGPNYSTVSACATASHAIADAFMTIQRGSADVMICGGSESPITEISIAGFNSMRALSTWNDRYEQASRPFDKDRNGFVMGEGAGALVLEEYEHAVNRGARIYAEICGIGLTADAHHITAPEPEGNGAMRSMRIAVEDAGLTPTDVDYVNAHGTSTPYNDITETKAIKQVFGDHAYTLSVSSIKSMTGHLLGAAGGIEAIATIMSVYSDCIPPTINLETPGEGCDLDYCPGVAKQRKVDVAISNTFGFGGHNATILFKKLQG